ncbi:MAG TPA: hypothetical protein VNY33_04900 [Gaiellaceae bacterium]|jgi:hypothetical protein|nr:hypothetical protein [Gaiellaceae bacterium]
MSRRAALVVLAALALAGCGSAVKHTASKPPQLPRALAQVWAQQADGVAGALAAGDGCTAQQLAGALRAEVVQAVNARQIPSAFQESLLATANDLTGRITCNPPEKPKHGKKQDKQGGGD